MSDYPLNFELKNDATTKFLNVVVKFKNSNIQFSLLPTYKKVKWGDPTIKWGQDGLIWGGLLLIPNVLQMLSPNTQLIIDQKLEPEQGRASAATMSLEFVDLRGFMSQFVTSGQYLDEILGNELVEVYLGYQDTSYPEDYLRMFRGYVSMITSVATKITLQLTDANLKRRQQIFKLGKTQLRQISHTFTSANVNFSTDTFTITAHNFKDGNKIQLFTDGTVPTPLSPATDYYIVNSAPNTFQLALTVGGAVIDLTTSGSGNMSVYLYGIGPLTATIPVIDCTDFIQPILGPNGTYDSSLSTYIKIDNELMEYSPVGLGTDTITVLRAQRGTSATDHDTTGNVGVENVIELEGNTIDLSLKIMLGGWVGNWITSQPILKFVQTGDPLYGNISTALILPDGTDAIADYGLSIGDYLYISGAANPTNNGQRIITNFLDLNGISNNIILVDIPFVIESIPTPAVFASRSQYDTLPLSCGSKLKPIDVDVNSWQTVQRQYLSGPSNTFRIFINSPQSGKEFIEKEFLLPSGAYSLTRFGRLSVTITKPPLAGENLVVLDKTTIIEPQNMMVRRGLNNRRFFNEVQYQFDYDDSGNSTNKVIRFDNESYSKTDTLSVLPIQAKGLRSDLGAETFVNNRLDFILKRYKDAAVEISLKTNWKSASLIEVTDIVALYDNGELQITNLETGERDMGSQLFEVIQRQIDIKSGTATLTLLGQTGYQINDRFAGIAPSSLVGVGSSTTEVILTDSFGSRYPFNEKKKWEPIIGDKIRIHSRDYTYDHVRTLMGFQAGSSYRMLIDTALPTSPLAGYVVDCYQYPDTADKTEQAKSKLLFSFIDPTLTVVTGISTTQFTVSVGDSSKIFVGLPIKIHNADYSLNSDESTVDSIVGVTVTLTQPISFIPSAGQKIELIGFRDLNGPYRNL